MDNLHGYLGVFQPPLNGNKSSIYCVTTPDRKTLVMIPLVANYFETAYSVIKDPKYQNIFIILPSIDMLLVSDSYLLFHEGYYVLGKRVEFFSASKCDIKVTDGFISHLTICDVDKTIQIAQYLNNDENCNIVFNYDGKNLPITRDAFDIYLSTLDKRLLFTEYMNEEKIERLNTEEEMNNIDEIHMPFTKNYYGGLSYIETRRHISPKYVSKLIAYGFTSIEEAEICTNMQYRCGEDKYHDFV